MVAIELATSGSVCILHSAEGTYIWRVWNSGSYEVAPFGGKGALIMVLPRPPAAPSPEIFLDLGVTKLRVSGLFGGFLSDLCPEVLGQ